MTWFALTVLCTLAFTFGFLLGAVLGTASDRD